MIRDVVTFGEACPMTTVVHLWSEYVRRTSGAGDCGDCGTLLGDRLRVTVLRTALHFWLTLGNVIKADSVAVQDCRRTWCVIYVVGVL
jgi:hypothetical protein